MHLLHRMLSRTTNLSSLRRPELVIISMPGHSVRPQHLMALLVSHHLVVGLVQGDPHFDVGPELSVAEPGIVCKRLCNPSEGGNASFSCILVSCLHYDL